MDPVSNPIAAPAAPIPAPAGVDVLAALQRYGIDVRRFQSQEAAFDALLRELVNTQQTLERAQPLIALGQEFAPHAQELRQTMQDVDAPSKDKAGFAPPPRPDARYEALLELENGVYKAPQTMPELQSVARQMNTWVDHQRRLVSDLSADPLGVMEKAGLSKRLDEREKAMRESIDKAIEERIVKYEEENTSRAFYRENEKRFLQIDEHGNRVVGPDGNPLPSQQGEAFIDLLGELEQAGVTGSRARRLAERMLAPAQSNGTAGPASAAPVAAAAPVDKRREFLDSARRGGAGTGIDASMTGTETAAGQPADQNPTGGLDNYVDNVIKEHGLTPRGDEGPPRP